MTTTAIQSGLRGTLSPEEYTTKVTPSWAETYAAARADYRDMDYVCVTYATDAHTAAALIPAELELITIPGLPGQAAASLVFAKYRECDLGPYMEVIVTIPVLHEGRPFGYVPAIYVDNDAALLAGRELGGYPKKMARITVRNYGDVFLSHMTRGPIQRKTVDPNFSDLASSSVTKGGRLFSVPLPADEPVHLPSPFDQLLPLPAPTGQPQDWVIPTMALRRVPGIGPGQDGVVGAEVLQLVGTPWHVTKAEVFAGDAASIELHPSAEDPIASVLPVNSVLAAFIIRGDMHTKADEWVLIEDLKNKTA